MTDDVHVALDELVQRFDNESGDWERVLRDSGRRRARLSDRRITRRRLALVLVAISAVATILVGSALALHRGSIDFWNAAPAPDRIVVDFGTMRALAIPGLGQNVIPGQARKVTSFDIDGKPRGLFVAPTADGGYCYRLRFVASCGRTGRTNESFGFGYLATRSGGVDWISGTFLSSEIARIEIGYDDGSVDLVPFVWVTAPIDAGFYALDVSDAGHRVTTIRAYDDDGDEVATRQLPSR